jgi:fatty acid desaturase
MDSWEPTPYLLSERTSLAGSEASTWFESLDPEIKAALQALEPNRPLWNLIGLFFVLIWIGSSYLILTFSAWPVQLIGTVVIATAIHGLWNVMHKGVHGNITYQPNLDRLIACLAGLPALFSASAYAVIHFDHHQYNRQARDPNELTNLTGSKPLLSLLFYSLLLFGTVLSIFLLPVEAIKRADRQQLLFILGEYLLMTSIYGLIFILAGRYSFIPQLVRVWLFPLLGASLFGNVRVWSEHALTPAGHPLTQTRTITSNRLVSLGFMNANYHLEHHLFPNMSWYHLPKVHQILQEEYSQAGTSIYGSYLKYLWQAAHIGVHGRTTNITLRSSPESN